MIFIYGTRPVILDQITPKTTSCSFCQSTGTVSITSHSTHTHLYYIPMFPTGIKVNSYCSECHFENKESQFPPEYAPHTQIVKNNSKTPLWQFSGVALIVAVILFVIIRTQVKSQEEASFIASPVAGDVYHYKAGYKAYSTMRVVSIYDDSIFYNHNLMEADMSNMFDELNVEANYDSDEVYFMLQTDLDSLNNAGALLDVVRESD